MKNKCWLIVDWGLIDIVPLFFFFSKLDLLDLSYDFLRNGSGGGRKFIILLYWEF